MTFGRYRGDGAGSATGNLIRGSVIDHAALPSSGNAIGDIYIVETTTGVRFINAKKSGLWRWSGDDWERLSDTTNYTRQGDNVSLLVNDAGYVLQSDIDLHADRIDNPHAVTADQVGLGNVDNTSDIDKPISTAVQDELNSINAELDMLFNWTYYATQWDMAPALVKSIAGGDVYNYTYSSVARYRFVPDIYSSTLDAFYSNFDTGTDTLSGLIAQRGQ